MAMKMRLSRLLLLAIVLAASLFVLYRRRHQLPGLPILKAAKDSPASRTRLRSWPPKQFQNIFAFGDSLSSTNFNTEYDMPTAENPFGGEYPGLTSSGGPNWLGFLIHDHMKQTLLFNFAQGGSHVNASEFHDPNPGTYDFTTQVDNFAAKVAARAGLPPWRPDTTLFVAWLGTNDVYGAFVRHLSPAVYPDILDTFFAQLDRLRALGATTFLTLTPQPLQHVRLHSFGNPLDTHLEGMVHAWNRALLARAQAWEAATGLQLEVLDVTTLVETALAGGVAQPCSALEDARPRDECMWEDKFHLGQIPHRLIAATASGIFGGWFDEAVRDALPNPPAP